MALKTVNTYKTITPYRSAADLSGNSTQATVPTPTVPCPIVNVNPYDLKGLGNYKDTYSAETKKITRRVKKWVFTGEETWTYSASEHGFCFNLPESERAAGLTPIMCSHFTNTYNYPAEDLRVRGSSELRGNALTFVYKDMHADMSCSVWKAWLRTEAAAGRPLTIYYVALTPTTEDAPLFTVTSYKTLIPIRPSIDLSGTTTQTGTPTPTSPIQMVDFQPYGLRKVGTVADIYTAATKKITRYTRVKVLTGEELSTRWAQTSNGIFILDLDYPEIADKGTGFCTHFSLQSAEQSTELANLKFMVGNSYFGFRYDATQTLAEFLDFIKACYAAGTPVTIYCAAHAYPIEETPPLLTIASYKKSTIYNSTKVAPICSDSLICGTFVVDEE